MDDSKTTYNIQDDLAVFPLTKSVKNGLLFFLV